MKTMKDFKGTKEDFIQDGKLVYALHQIGWKKGEPVMSNRFYAGIQFNLHEGVTEDEILANAKLFANSKKVLEAAIGVCREFDDPNDATEAFKKLEQAINDSL